MSTFNIFQDRYYGKYRGHLAFNSGGVTPVSDNDLAEVTISENKTINIKTQDSSSVSTEGIDFTINEPDVSFITDITGRRYSLLSSFPITIGGEAHTLLFSFSTPPLAAPYASVQIFNNTTLGVYIYINSKVEEPVVEEPEPEEEPRSNFGLIFMIFSLISIILLIGLIIFLFNF